MQSFKNGTKVCGGMGYVVEGLRTSLGCEDVWIGVLVQCYTECNTQEVFIPLKSVLTKPRNEGIMPRVTR